MTGRRTYLYRLHVEYPAGSDEPGWEPPAWTGYQTREVMEGEGGAIVTIPFSWPALRTYLSRSGANKRADLLRSYGATVEIERSKPVEWT